MPLSQGVEVCFVTDIGIPVITSFLLKNFYLRTELDMWIGEGTLALIDVEEFALIGTGVAVQ